MVKNPPANEGDSIQSLGQEDTLEWGLATHSSILAWRLLWTGQESLEGYSMEGHKEADTTELLSIAQHSILGEYRFQKSHDFVVSLVMSPGTRVVLGPWHLLRKGLLDD